MNTRNSVCICAVAVALGGCNNHDRSKQGPTAVVSTAAAATLPPAARPVPAEPPPAPVERPKAELEISAKAATMMFDKSSLTVPAGSIVHLVMKNSKPGLLSHNWVLVRPGTEASVAAAGLTAGPTGNYVTPGSDVLAFTPLAQPGKDSEVTFDAPPAGTYPYICSFPGHYMMMKGTLTVTP